MRPRKNTTEEAVVAAMHASSLFLYPNAHMDHRLRKVEQETEEKPPLPAAVGAV